MKTQTTEIKPGDYVLATKYNDGDPGDHWCVGFYKGILENCTELRHMVVDGDGKNFRANGFRRVAHIDKELAEWLLKNADELERAPLGSICLWDLHARRQKYLEEIA